MKTAQALMRELRRHVILPHGVAIELIEVPSRRPGEQNWRAGAGAMNDLESDRFSQKVAELNKSDPQIDWLGEEGQSGHRRVILRAS
jgi:hypothetical protein